MIRRSISIAMVLSVVIHLVSLILIGWLITDRAEPPEAPPVLIVKLQSEQTGDGFADRNLHDHTTTSESTRPAKEREPGGVSNQQAKTAVASKAVAAPAKNVNNLSPEASAPGLGVQAASDAGKADVPVDVAPSATAALVAKSDAVTAAPKNEPIVTATASENGRPAFVQAPLSPKQEKMLKRKFKKWTENFHRMPDAAAGLTWKSKGQEYAAKFTHLPANNDMGIDRVVVEISTEEDGKRLSTEMRMKRLAFSSYAQFVNKWDPNVQIHNDELEGRFHSNSEINLAYSRKIKPQFHGEVTTSARRINITERRGHFGRDQIFLGGLQTSVRAIHLPKRLFAFASQVDVADDQIHRFDEDMRITFYADGTYGWQTIGEELPQRRTAISRDASYIIAAKGVKLYVRGTVNGRVLVYSPERIIIEDDIVYEQDPAKRSGADDYLGLASDKYIDIAPSDVTGPGDLVINAAIYAKRRFAVKGYRARDSALLHIYGSLTAGSLSATEPRYYTKIQFDPRLEQLRPPGFPVTDRYTVESVDTGWTVEPTEMPR